MDCYLVITHELGYTVIGKQRIFQGTRRELSDMNAVYWLIAIIILLVIEAMTMALTTIWFAGGALAAFIACVAGAGLEAQEILFVAVSLLLLFFTRPFAKRYINQGTKKTNVEGLIGREARVTEQVDNQMDRGEAVLSGQYWSARAADENEVIEQGTRVVVEAVRGVKLIVRTIK